VTLTLLFLWSGMAGSALAAQAPQARQGSSDYVIGAQDVLKINVFGESDLSGSFKVDADGTIQYPFLGRVVVANQSVSQVSELLQKQLESGFVRRAQVVVDIEQFRVRNVSVWASGTPGKYPIGSQLTLIEALAAAGSTTANAGGDVLILRAPAPGAAASTPEERTVRVSLADLQVGRQNVVLLEGTRSQRRKAHITAGEEPRRLHYERNLTVRRRWRLPAV
jgi:polysaccharide export outer membrane protein